MAVRLLVASALACVALGTRIPRPLHDAILEVPVAAADGPAASASEPASLVEASASSAWAGSQAAVGALAFAGAGRQRGLAPAPGRGDALHMFPVDLPPPPPAIEQQVPAKIAAFSMYYDGIYDNMARAHPYGLRSATKEKFPVTLPGGEQVSFEVAPAGPATDRCVAIMKLLGQSPGVSSCIMTQTAGDRTWTLMDSREAMDLGRRFGELRAEKRAQGEPFMPLKESLPFLVDLLRGVQSLGTQNVVHLDLTSPRNVALVLDGSSGREHRAVITGLGRAACVLNTKDPVLSCDRILDTSPTLGCAFRMAPEPLAATQNMWQVGLVFSKMNLGTFPTESVVQGRDRITPGGSDKVTSEARSDTILGGGDCEDRCSPSKEDVASDLKQFAAERESIQRSIREEFVLEDNADFKAFSRKYPDVARLMSGMLEKNPEQRWTPAQALEQTIAVMDKYKIDVPLPNEPVILEGKGLPANLAQADDPEHPTALLRRDHKDLKFSPGFVPPP